jgi:hypothetical protein
MDSNNPFLRDLAARVFATPERWGWEYREPHPPRPSPERDAEPLWYEPAGASGGSAAGGPDASASAAIRREQLPRRIGICIGLLFVGLVISQVFNGLGILIVLATFGLAAFWFLPLLITARPGPDPVQAHLSVQREQAWAEYSQNWQTWHSAVQNWDAGEQARLAVEDLWFPVVAAPRTARIDVFGGVPDGWAALLTTMGASTLKAGNSMLVLDLTEHDLSSELVDLAAALDQPAGVWDLPADLGRADLLRGLEAEDVGEIIAEAVHSTRDPAALDLRGLDADLIRAVADRLDGELTFRRLSAGLQVLRRSYDDTDREQPPLAAAELQRLTAYVDAAAPDASTQAELTLLAGQIDLLAGLDTGPVAAGPGLWPAGLLVLRTLDRNPRRKDFMDRVLVQTVIHHLRLRPARNSSDVLFVAGCDHLGLRALESLTRQARRSGLRIVLILEHLRDDVEKLLGGSDSASLIMRMGNAKEAAMAAEFIGRGHTFVLNQLTRRLSDAATEGEAKQWGASSGVTDTTGRTGFEYARSHGVTRADTWSRTVNWSTTKTQSEGVTSSRVYEFTVEPTQIQGMPLTAFMFIEAAEGQRRVIAGDCNPALSMLDRVAGRPALEPPRPAADPTRPTLGQHAPPPGLEPPPA